MASDGSASAEPKPGVVTSSRLSRVLRAERALRKSQERFRQVVEAAPNAIVMVNARGLIEMVNAQTERLFGYPREELLGRPMETLVPERFRRQHPALRNAYLAAPQSRPMGAGRDLFGLRKDGTEFPVEIGLNPIETEEGTMVLSAIVDISARQRMEERFRLLVKAAPNAMVMVDRDGNIELVNAEAEHLFGYSAGDMIGRSIEMLVPERLRGHHPGLREVFFEEPRARPMGAGRDLYGLRKDGTEFPVEIGLNPIETEEGTMVLSAIVDISDRKQKEERIQQALLEKNILLGEIHHRVKNNLQIVYSLLDLKSAQISDPVLVDVLRESQNRIRSMALIHQTLYESRDFARVDFAGFLQTLVRTLLASYGVDPAQIAVVFEAADVHLPIDSAVPCGLIVNELLSNAFKHAFTDQRAGQVTIRLIAETEKNIILSVSDDGVGLPPDLDIEQATTLGLQLVSLLTEQLGGTLVVRPRHPTAFIMRFSTANRRTP